MQKAYRIQVQDEMQSEAALQIAPMRVNKYLAQSGYCSRRAADTLVAEGKVTIDGTPAQAGTQVLQGQQVQVQGQTVRLQTQQHCYILLHKPVGVTCTVEPEVQGNLVEFMRHPKRIFPVGRLDKDSSGLLILTSDGEIVNKILRAEQGHEKEYIVQLDKPLQQEFLQALRTGVEITNMRTKQRQRTKPCTVRQLGERRFSIVLTQGLNRQIRRMCTELGYHVQSLQRVRIMHLTLNGLPKGGWRYFTQNEFDTLMRRLAEC